MRVMHCCTDFLALLLQSTVGSEAKPAGDTGAYYKALKGYCDPAGKAAIKTSISHALSLTMNNAHAEKTPEKFVEVVAQKFSALRSRIKKTDTDATMIDGNYRLDILASF
jgi:hypothetical protein